MGALALLAHCVEDAYSALLIKRGNFETMTVFLLVPPDCGESNFDIVKLKALCFLNPGILLEEDVHKRNWMCLYSSSSNSAYWMIQ